MHRTVSQNPEAQHTPRCLLQMPKLTPECPLSTEKPVAVQRDGRNCCSFPLEGKTPSLGARAAPTPPVTLGPSSRTHPAAVSPVWVRTWRFRSKVSLKPFPQKVHRCLFTWLWHLTCRFSMRCRRKPLPHSSQECTAASVQVPVVNWGTEETG